MIISAQNEKIKNIIKLRKARERKKQGLIVIDGRKEIEMALRRGSGRALSYGLGPEIIELFVCPELTLRDLKIKNTTEVSKEVFEKISYRENPDGYLALARPKFLSLDEIKLNDNPLIIVLEKIEKPGNLGAILRTADAVGADAVILNGTQVDIYNPNAIRASIGTIFTNQVVSGSAGETINWLKKNKIKTFAAALPAKKIYSDENYIGPAAIIMGSEHEGLSDEWLNAADKLIKIPMRGQADSLNLSVSAAIIIFEIWRQRGFK